MILSEEERQAFDLYFAHAYQAAVNKRALAQHAQQGHGPLAMMMADPIEMAAETAMKMLQARREQLGDEMS